MARLKTKQAEFLQQVSTLFGATTPETLAAAGISAAQWDAAEGNATTTQASVAAADAAKASYKGAIQAKDQNLTDLRGVLQGYVDRFYATPSISNETLAKMGLPPRPGPALPTPPRQVTGLVAVPNANGTARLRWKRSGNTRSTSFLVEVQTPTGWAQIAATLSSTYVDEDAPPGLTKWYRIVASNVRGRAVPSQAIPIYGEGEGEGLDLAA